MTRTPPGPKGYFPGSLLLQFRKDSLGLLERITRKYGDVVYLRLGREKAFVINHPDLIREVLVTQHKNFTKGRGLERVKRFLGEGLLTSEGELHLRQRRMIQPAFHQRVMAGFAEVMTTLAGRTGEQWRDGQAIDASEDMMRLTLAIVGQALFGARFESDATEIGAALTATMHAFPLMMLPFADVIERLPLPAIRRMKAARARLDGIIYALIDARRASGEDRDDLLSMLISAQDEENAATRMSDQQVRDEAMTLFLAGHETTANALSWTWYLLSQNAGVERQFHEEIDRVLNGRPPTLADLPALVFAGKVIRESMRLYPPAWVLGRRAIAACELGAYTVPARAIIFMSQYVMHRDARFFPEPQRFHPDRWTPVFTASLPKYAYFPFGGGPRQCIGEGFAWMEAILVLATIGRHWTLRLAPGCTPVPQPLVTLRIKGGLPMSVHRRTH